MHFELSFNSTNQSIHYRRIFKDSVHLINMGREIDDTPAPSHPPASLTEEIAESTTSSTNPETPSQLPSAALDLAAKLFQLARNGDTPTLSQYVTAGVPTNLTNHNGDSLLMLASYHGNVDTVKMLVEKGADLNVVNARGQSILSGAIFKMHNEVVKILYEHGADKELGQPTPVQTAMMFKNKEVLELFGESTEGLENAGVGFGIPGMPAMPAPGGA